jgi:uncharacterized membrane protein YfcA
MTMLLVALFFALLIGLSLGLLGGGGSILTVPILRYVLGMEGHEAIATSLLVVGTTSLAALVAHARKGRVLWRTGFVFGGAGMVGAFLAGTVAHRIPAELLLAAFSLMMFATAIAMLRPERNSRQATSKASVRRATRLPLLKVVLEGLVVGAVTGLVGAGGGFLVVPALVLLGRLPMATAIGTSLLVIALKSFAGFAGYAGHTSIDWQLALGVSAFAVAGSVGGSWLATRLSARTLRQGFGWFVVAMAFFILARELPPLIGWASPLGIAALASLAGTALVAGLRWLAARRRSRREPPHPHSTASSRAPAPPLHSELERKWS